MEARAGWVTSGAKLPTKRYLDKTKKTKRDPSMRRFHQHLKRIEIALLINFSLPRLEEGAGELCTGVGMMVFDEGGMAPPSVPDFGIPRPEASETDGAELSTDFYFHK